MKSELNLITRLQMFKFPCGRRAWTELKSVTQRSHTREQPDRAVSTLQRHNSCPANNQCVQNTNDKVPCM